MALKCWFSCFPCRDESWTWHSHHVFLDTAEEAIIFELHPAASELCRCERPRSLEACGLDSVLPQQRAADCDVSESATSSITRWGNTGKYNTGYSVFRVPHVVGRTRFTCAGDTRARCTAATQHTRWGAWICGQQRCLFVSASHQAATAVQSSQVWNKVRCSCWC